jgi:hypothetical protein
MTTVRTDEGGGIAPLLILLFCVVAVLAEPPFRGCSNAWAQLNASQTQSAFRLVGTIEGGPITGAVIDDTKNPQAFYRLNEKLPDESQIVKVRCDYIVLKWPDGTRTELYATPGTGGVNARVATTTAAPSIPSRRVDQQPTPSGQDATSRRPPRVDRQITNQQAAKIQDPNARTGGGGGNRNKPRPNNRN